MAEQRQRTRMTIPAWPFGIRRGRREWPRCLALWNESRQVSPARSNLAVYAHLMIETQQTCLGDMPWRMFAVVGGAPAGALAGALIRPICTQRFVSFCLTLLSMDP